MSLLNGYCRIEGCENPAGRTGICESHLHVTRKEKRQASRPVAKAAPLRRMPVQRLSEKRVEQNTEYLVEHGPYLVEHPKCEACGDPSEEVHHKNGRFGERLLDQTFWMAVCKVCHREIHANPEWAREQGYLILRSV